MVTQTHTQSIREIMIIVKVIKEGRTRKSGNVNTNLTVEFTLKNECKAISTICKLY